MISAALIGYGRFGKLFHHFFSRHFEFKVYDAVQNNTGEIQNQLCPDFFDVDYIFFAVPISKLEDSIKSISEFVKAETVLVDMCSVKEYPVKLLMKYFPKNEIIGTHPLFGPESAINTLAAHQIALIKTKNSSEKYDELKLIFEKEFLKIIEMSAEEHDKQMAWTLCLTQFIGRGLNNLPLPENNIGTKGYFDLLAIVKRANADTDQLFLDMNLFNEYAKEMRKKVLDKFCVLNSELEAKSHSDNCS